MPVPQARSGRRGDESVCRNICRELSRDSRRISEFEKRVGRIKRFMSRVRGGVGKSVT